MGDGDYDSGEDGARSAILAMNYHLLGLAVVFGVFGGLHCIPWNFPFPSEFLRTTWRAMSMILIISPIIVMVTLCLVGALHLSALNRYLSYTFDVVAFAAELILAVFYTLARIGLLVEAAYLLRDMPDSALQVVDWMYFLPHI